MKIRGFAGAAGFSLLELVIVLSMAMVASAIAVPIMVRMVADSQLHRGMGDLSGLYQTSRMLAVRGNTITRVRYQLSGSNWVAYEDDGMSAHGINRTTPQLWLPRRLSKVAAPTGTAPSPLDAASCGSTITPDTTDDTYFNQMGIPCLSSGGSCTSNSSFAYYFTYSGNLNMNTSWAALCVSPAGRTKAWYWTGSEWTN